MVKFLRRTWSRYSKLGKRRKKKQVWRKPTGRDNKMREKRKRNGKLIAFAMAHPDYTHDAIGRIFHLDRSRVTRILQKGKNDDGDTERKAEA